MDAQERKQIAETILAQLGGSRFTQLTGSSGFTTLESGLSFSIPKGRYGINRVEVQYIRGRDTYKMLFLRKWGKNLTTVSTHDDVYCDMLQDLFEQETGYTTAI